MRRKRVAARAKRILAWAALFLAAAQLSLIAYIDARRPDLYDHEYHVRLTSLKARIEETPDRPLLLLLGSSRTTLGFRPEILAPLATASGQQPLVYNFSHIGAGPVALLMEFHRLLGQGIRPDWLVLELMPPFLANDRLGHTTSLAAFGDLPLLQRYLGPLRTYGTYFGKHANPWQKHRAALIHELAPALLPWNALADWTLCLDRLGGNTARGRADGVGKVDTFTARESADCFARLHDYRIVAGPCRAVRDTLELCRRERIKTVLVVTPESSAFQSWYSPQARADIQRLCRDLTQDFNVPVVDARGWLDDSDFMDGHHVFVHGADAFTLRLGTEVLQPLVEGRLQPHGTFVEKQCDIPKFAWRLGESLQEALQGDTLRPEYRSPE